MCSSRPRDQKLVSNWNEKNPNTPFPISKTKESVAGTAAPEENMTNQMSNNKKKKVAAGKNKKSGSKIKTSGGTSISSASMDLNIPN